MKIFFDLEKDLLKLHASFEERSEKVRESFKIIANSRSQIVKNAFDTRRINSETDINPRRNLQNYQRSEPFISEDLSNKIKILFKIKRAADSIKEQFIGDPDWFDSNSRILCNAVDNTLRVEQKDYDFFKPQFDYLDELLYLRYRLASSDIERLSDEEIRNVLLKKDEKLMYKTIYSNYRPVQPIQIGQPTQPVLLSTGTKEKEDSLAEKLFGNVKANKENRSVERSINIIIKDSILDEKESISKTSNQSSIPKSGEEANKEE